MDDIIISFFGVDNKLSRGFIFGIVHVSIMLLGYYSGFSINRLLKILSNGYIAGIIGAGITHILADLIAALIDPSMRRYIRNCYWRTFATSSSTFFRESSC